MTLGIRNRLTRRTTARALDGQGSSGDARVDQVLAASKAPASPFELNREADMVAMFRAARLATGTSVVKLTMVQAARKRVAAAKVGIATGVAVVVTGTGVAFAATGHVPFVSSGDNASPNGKTHSSRAPGQATTGPHGPKSSAAPNGTPSPSLKGLCTAYLHRGDTPGQALGTPSFAALVKAAGGRENVAAYCVALVSTPGSQPSASGTVKPGGKPSDHPTHPAHPTHPSHPAHPSNTPNANSTKTPGQDPTKTKGPNANSTKKPGQHKPTVTPTP